MQLPVIFLLITWKIGPYVVAEVADSYDARRNSDLQDFNPMPSRLANSQPYAARNLYNPNVPDDQYFAPLSAQGRGILNYNNFNQYYNFANVPWVSDAYQFRALQQHANFLPFNAGSGHNQDSIIEFSYPGENYKSLESEVKRSLQVKNLIHRPRLMQRFKSLNPWQHRRGQDLRRLAQERWRSGPKNRRRFVQAGSIGTPNHIHMHSRLQGYPSRQHPNSIQEVLAQEHFPRYAGTPQLNSIPAQTAQVLQEQNFQQSPHVSFHQYSGNSNSTEVSHQEYQHQPQYLRNSYYSNYQHMPEEQREDPHQPTSFPKPIQSHPSVQPIYSDVALWRGQGSHEPYHPHRPYENYHVQPHQHNIRGEIYQSSLSLLNAGIQTLTSSIWEIMETLISSASLFLYVVYSVIVTPFQSVDSYWGW